MEHSIIVAKRIVDLIPAGTSPIHGTEHNLCAFAVDFAKLCKNIKETSINDEDRKIRAKKLANDSGIDYSFIIQLTQ